MEKAGSSQADRVPIKKPKKKQPVNSESDKQKQAEKKKRRLDKALAASRAIISELEKKKQNKKQEEKEAPHIAESVALHVLVGEDATEDPNTTRLQPVINSEIEKQKQAEKKKRRLEKALAASAAIISELEKKKQKKQEEQDRLEKEGARIAESVALHVLVGEGEDAAEDLDETRLLPGRPVRKFSGWVGEYYGFGPLSFGGEWGTGGVLFPWEGFDFCPAQGVSSLQIREDGLQDASLFRV